MRRGRLASCRLTVTGEKVTSLGGEREIRHIRIVAPDTAVLAEAERAVEGATERCGLQFRRWASPRDGRGFILYEIAQEKKRLCSVLLLPASAENLRSTAHFPPEEGELHAPKLPEHFRGDYRIAIIIDDLGSDWEAAETLSRLPENITFSILPNQQYTRETADMAKSRGKEIMVHLPLEPEAREGLALDAHTILTSMSAAEVESIFDQDLASVPYAVGINNHMGSKATANRALMMEVLALVKLRGLYFIDSRTTPETQAYEVARELGVPADFRSVFLDDKANVNYTEGQLNLLLRRMFEQGSAIAIGHPHPTTIEALKRTLPALERRGVKIVFVSHLVS